MDARIEDVAIVGVGVGTIIPNDGSWPRESRGAHRRWATAVYLHEAKEPVRHNRAETRRDRFSENVKDMTTRNRIEPQFATTTPAANG